MDNKTMVQGSKAVGRDVPVARDIDTPGVPGDYHEYMGSNSKQMETFSNRASALEAALGNKDSAKG